jgi:hypothetical protein
MMRFFFAGKKIPNCLARATSGSYPNYSATCSWRPPVHGTQRIHSSITPTDGALGTMSSPAATIFVFKRTTLR